MRDFYLHVHVNLPCCSESHSSVAMDLDSLVREELCTALNLPRSLASEVILRGVTSEGWNIATSPSTVLTLSTTALQLEMVLFGIVMSFPIFVFLTMNYVFR